jgi:putative tryptophan/tyrosine transport system substrate-binding protein
MRFIHLRRREFITLLGGAGAGWLLPVRAQESSRTYRLGCVFPIGRQAPPVVAFFDELRLNGFIEGQNLTIVAGSFGIETSPLAERAATVVRAAPDVIVSGGNPNTHAAQDATGTVPIVSISNDLVREGLVQSLARPGRNTTGVSILSPELDGKRQDLLMEAAPGARRIATLADPAITTSQQLQALQDAAHPHGVDLLPFVVGKPDEILPAIDNAKAAGAEALNVLGTPLFFVHSRSIIERVAALRLPTIYQWPELAEEGGLAGYGPRITNVYRQAAQLTVKVLRGAKPADLPVEQPTRFELVINLKTAKAIGHEVPAGLVLRADKVIE